MRSDGRVVSPDVTFTITPAVPAASIAFASAWHDHMVTNRFCSTTSRSASSSRSTNAAGIASRERTDVVDRDVEATELVDDALRRGPAPRRDRGGRRSPRATRVPAPATSAAASASVAPSLSASTTSHPAAASQRAMPRPMPTAAPVTSARFPSSPRSTAITVNVPRRVVTTLSDLSAVAHHHERRESRPPGGSGP